MAYNNPFPVNYQPYAYPQPQIQPQIPPQTPQGNNSSMIWVQGETGAKSYLVAPNVTIPLWDSENQTIYLKSADASGMPNIRILDYTFRDSTPTKSPIEKAEDHYATKKDIEMLEERVDELTLKIAAPSKMKKKVVVDDED